MRLQGDENQVNCSPLNVHWVQPKGMLQMSDYIATMEIPENYKHEFLNNILRAVNIDRLSKFLSFKLIV